MLQAVLVRFIMRLTLSDIKRRMLEVAEVRRLSILRHESTLVDCDVIIAGLRQLCTHRFENKVCYYCGSHESRSPS